MSYRKLLCMLLLECVLFAMCPVWADQVSQRTSYGASLSLLGQLVELNAPICSPAAGSYSVAYRNSVATGCTARSVGGSDVDALLVFAGGSAATYTMPQSSVTTFTGSISGTTLTTPSNAVVIGSAITGTGVIDNTYVTAGSGTSWTVNNSQTIGSETLTQAVYRPGEGTCFLNQGTALLTLTATTSTIGYAAGVVNGNPAVVGGPVVLYPGGRACLQANTSNNYVVSDFLPGTWYQGAPQSAPVSSFAWTGLSGYPQLHLSCSGLGAISSSAQIRMQLAYGGTFQATGYVYQGWYNLSTASAMATFSSSGDTAFVLSGFLPVNINHEATLDANLSFAFGTGMGFSNNVYTTVRHTDNAAGGEERVDVSGEAPLTTSQSVTGVQIFPGSGTFYGMCKLSPKVM